MVGNILFVEPALRTDKLGLLYLSAVLKQAGHNVDMIQDFGHGEVERYLEDHLTQFVMYSVTTGNHNWYLERNRELRREFNFISVMGGPHFTYFPEDGVYDLAVDYIARGPGEDIIVQIIENLPEDKLWTGQIPDIRDLPFPDRSILYKYPKFGESRMKRFIAGRDCKHSCTYCFNHLYHRMFRGQRERFHQITEPQRMMEEIEEVREQWGLELVYFNDDDLARDEGWLEEFCGIFAGHGLTFCGSVRADSLTHEIVEMMAEAGCTFLNIALESSVPETQRLLRRGRVTNNDIFNAVRWCEENGIKVRLQNMIGLPVDDPLGDALITLEFNINVAPTDSWVAIFQPFPKTDIWKLCIEKGLISKTTDAKTFFDETVLDIPEANKINRLAHWWYPAVKNRWPRQVILDLLEMPLTSSQKAAMRQTRWLKTAKEIYGL